MVGAEDSDALIKPKAYVVLRQGYTASAHLTTELQDFVKTKIAPYKYPRWIEFIADIAQDRDWQDPAFQAARALAAGGERAMLSAAQVSPARQQSGYAARQSRQGALPIANIAAARPQTSP